MIELSTLTSYSLKERSTITTLDFEGIDCSPEKFDQDNNMESVDEGYMRPNSQTQIRMQRHEGWSHIMNRIEAQSHWSDLDSN